MPKDKRRSIKSQRAAPSSSASRRKRYSSYGRKKRQSSKEDQKHPSAKSKGIRTCSPTRNVTSEEEELRIDAEKQRQMCVEEAFVEEYWVSLQLGNDQLNQYRSVLHHSMTQNSLIDRRSIVSALLACCDHPFFVEDSLKTSLIREFGARECLISNARESIKLRFLERLITKARDSGRRMIVLYSSQKTHNDYNTDEELLLKSLPWDVCMSEETAQETIASFNSPQQDSHRRSTALLLEKSVCNKGLSAARVYDVDLVVIFNSDYSDLSKDIGLLKKIEFVGRSNRRRLKVFRLYCSDTLEEAMAKPAEMDPVLRSDKFETVVEKGAQSLLPMDGTKKVERHSDAFELDKTLQDLARTLCILSGCELPQPFENALIRRSVSHENIEENPVTFQGRSDQLESEVHDKTKRWDMPKTKARSSKRNRNKL